MRFTTQRRGKTVKAGMGGGSTLIGYQPQCHGGCTIAEIHPHSCSTQVRSCCPRYAMSAQMHWSRSQASYAAANSQGATSVPVRSAGWTRTHKRRPVVFTRRYRVRPWSVLAPSSPWGPSLFGGFHRLGFDDRCRGRPMECRPHCGAIVHSLCQVPPWRHARDV